VLPQAMRTMFVSSRVSVVTADLRTAEREVEGVVPRPSENVTEPSCSHVCTRVRAHTHTHTHKSFRETCIVNGVEACKALHGGLPSPSTGFAESVVRNMFTLH
jgi:hypothetical protein